jgi:predicted DNA-binding protein (MmcQ/YjbR family)
VPDAEVAELVDDSYLLIAGRLPRAKRPAGWDG